MEPADCTQPAAEPQTSTRAAVPGAGEKNCFKQFAFELVSRISKGRGNQQNSVKQRHHLWLHLYYKHGFNPTYHCCHVRCDQKIRISFFV